MVVKNHNVEDKAISVIKDIFNTWCIEETFPYNADTLDLRSNDKTQYYDGQIVISHKLTKENKGLRFFIQSKGTTSRTYSGIKNYDKLLLDISNHKIPTFLFIVYLNKQTLAPNKFQFLFLNEERLGAKFSSTRCTTISDLNLETESGRKEIRKKVEEIISLARRHYFYSLSNRFVNDIPTEVHHEVDKYNALLDREFYSVKKAIYSDIWKFSIFYDLDRGIFGRCSIPYGYSCSLIQEIPFGNHFWQEVCDRWGDFDWRKGKISTFLLQKDLELCIKNKLFDLSCLKDTPRFGRIKGMNIEVNNSYAEEIFSFLAQNFESAYEKFCHDNFPLLQGELRLNSCTILSPKVTKPDMPRVGWNDSSMFRKKITNERIIISNEYDGIGFDSNKRRDVGIYESCSGVYLYCSQDILVDSIYQTLTNKLKKLGYLHDSFSLNFTTGIEFE